MYRSTILPAMGIVATIMFSACGYHTGGKAELVPKSIQTIAIPAFANGSTRYKLTDQLPRDIAREFRARTRFKIEEDPSAADAVLNGAVNSVYTFPTVYDPASGKATSVQVAVRLSITLIERATGRVLYSDSNVTAKQSFDIAASNIVGSPGSSANNNQISAHNFFDESSFAYDRLGRDVARQVVAGIVEDF